MEPDRAGRGARRPGVSGDRRGARQDARPGRDPLAPPARQRRDPEVGHAGADPGELRRLRLRAERAGGRDQRRSKGLPHRAGPRHASSGSRQRARRSVAASASSPIAAVLRRLGEQRVDPADHGRGQLGGERGAGLLGRGRRSASPRSAGWTSRCSARPRGPAAWISSHRRADQLRLARRALRSTRARPPPAAPPTGRLRPRRIARSAPAAASVVSEYNARKQSSLSAKCS